MSYLHSLFSIPVESKWNENTLVWTGSRFSGRLPTFRGLVSDAGAGRSGRMRLELILGFNCSRERERENGSAVKSSPLRESDRATWNSWDSFKATSRQKWSKNWWKLSLENYQIIKLPNRLIILTGRNIFVVLRISWLYLISFTLTLWNNLLP